MNKFYLTSAIPYTNALPHVGHAQEFTISDVIRRYHSEKGEDVKYLCGSDENGLKIVRAAEEKNLDPKVFTDKNQAEFKKLAKKLSVEFDFWQRGSSPKHHRASQLLWKKCAENGDIYKKNYHGLYCVGCEAFYTRDELDENGECYEHPGTKLEEVTEENYFFRLSRYQKFLEDLIKNDKLFIIPDFRKNETLSFIEQGLKDFSISRSQKRARNWGVTVPGDKNQIIYVWFDALNIYQSGIGFSWNEDLYRKYWPADLQVIGKGINRFHSIFWPAMLKSAGLKLPKKLFVHGYLTVNGQKMSKTLGNVINPIEVINKFGSDPLRYYLLREIPSYRDGDYSERRFRQLYNADLANGLGNLVSRVAKLCETSGFVRTEKKSKRELKKEVINKLERFQFDEALAFIWNSGTNWGLKWLDTDINNSKPWEIRDTDQLFEKLNLYTENILDIAYNLKPFLPETADKITKQFEKEKIKSSEALFPRLK